MSTKSGLQGIKSLAKAVRRHKKGTKAGLRTGLLRAGLFLMRESMQIVPIDLSPLWESADTRIEGRGWNVAVIVSYGTNYGIYVHEDLTARHQPGKSAKFLEKPAREHSDNGRLAEIIADAMREQL